MVRSYYSEDLSKFLDDNKDSILVKLIENETMQQNDNQINAWKRQITILQNQLRKLKSGRIMFEYTIPRMGKRVDTVLIHSNFVFVIEFKVNETTYHKKDVNQCIDYALDLKNFHEASHDASIVPVLIATDANEFDNSNVHKREDGLYQLSRSNQSGINKIILCVLKCKPDSSIDSNSWESSVYRPTPTIIESAKVMCSKLDTMDDIVQAGATNLHSTTQVIEKIIQDAKSNGTKAICFVTGVPGSGKTLVGLRTICSQQDNSVLLSGNKALVDVLRETLKNAQKNNLQKKNAQKKNDESTGGEAALVIHIPYFRDTITNGKPFHDRIIIFDEAQRAWSAKKLDAQYKQNKAEPLNMSDPELLLKAVDDRKGWSVVICLVGERQEIHDGEVGLTGWLDAIRKRRTEWSVYHSDHILERGYIGAGESGLEGIEHKTLPGLHLDTSIRSFKAESLAKLIRDMLDGKVDDAQKTYREIRDRYPIMITRNLVKAKEWLRNMAWGTERYGLVASSGATRLKPHGIYVKSSIDPVKWFLHDSSDMRSSYFLEDVATEFDIQGLELDWVCLAWDANLRFTNGNWSHYKFHGDDWRSIKNPDKREHLENAYRVLMTRARQGMVIFVPEGDKDDRTRKPEFYDWTFDYLKRIGFKVLD